MIRIEKAEFEHLAELTAVAKETFIQSHGHSASAADIQTYLSANYSIDIFQAEINQSNAAYRLLFYKNQMVGYSKIVFDQPAKNVKEKNTTKLARIYILEAFHGLGLGEELFNFNLNLAKENNQAGIWLFTWVENKRAIRFYEKMGFKIIGSHDFKISATHTNPNHQMYLAF
jgi:ribosomal protein S18 acetylase RimI-like enzyme